MLIDWKVVGKRCREAREYVGFTQEQVAKRMGIHRPSYSEVEAGNRKLTIPELETLSNLFRRSKEWLLGEERVVKLPEGLEDKVADLPAQDVDELIKFAEFLRFKRAKG